MELYLYKSSLILFSAFGGNIVARGRGDELGELGKPGH